ncbi:MAG: hypothetical protein ACR2NY_00265 [Alphaproteobacteria bacterium]
MPIVFLIFFFISLQAAMAQDFFNFQKSSDHVNNVILSADGGIEWDKDKNNLTGFGNSILSRGNMTLKSQETLRLFSKPESTNHKTKIDRVVAKTSALLTTDKILASADKIEMLFSADRFYKNDEVVKRINFFNRAKIIAKKNNNNDMILYANRASGYRYKKSKIILAKFNPRNFNKNPFAELEATGAVKINEQTFDAKGNRLIWFFDDNIGWLYGREVVVITKKNKTSDKQNIIYAKKLLEYNEGESWARAKNGVRIITKKKETIIGRRGYYFPLKDMFVICGKVSLTRLNKKGQRETIKGQCANSDLKTGISHIEGRNLEKSMLKIVGADNLLPKTKTLKKLNNQPLDNRGRVRAIINLE